MGDFPPAPALDERRPAPLISVRQEIRIMIVIVTEMC